MSGSALKSPFSDVDVRRFWSNVRIGTQVECWEWTASRDRYGYGQIHIGGRNCRSHRVSYAMVHGHVDPGSKILHSCDNPPCVNPSHLRMGTMKQNTEDMLRRGRDRHGVMPGSSNPFAKLTEDDVRRMRSLFDSGEKSRVELANMFRVTTANVCLIVARKAWKHVV